MKFNQLVDDAAEKFEVAQAANFADLAKQYIYKHNAHNYKANIIIISTNSLLTGKNSPSAALTCVT